MTTGFHIGSHKDDQQTKYLSQAVQLEESTNPFIVRSTMFVISTAIVVFLVWSAFTNINEVARTPGEIIPHGHQQVVQHLEGGIVREIDVREGQMVEKDQILLRLDGAGSQEDLDRALTRQTVLALQEERLRAFVDGRKPDFTRYEAKYPSLVKDQKASFDSMTLARDEEGKVIEDQIRQKEHFIKTIESELETAAGSYTITKDLYDRRRALNKKGYVSDVQFLESKQSLNAIAGDIKRLRNQQAEAQATIDEYNKRLTSLDSRHRDEAYEKLDGVLASQAENADIIDKLQSRVARLDVKAPVRGLVKGLSVNTVGAVVQPGQTLMEVVPLDAKLEVQIRIPPRHIGHLKVGQDVQVKFSSFDFSRYGAVEGKLDYISPTTFTGEQGDRYYQGRVLLDRNYVGRDSHNIIMPGMTVMADIVTGDKTILEYLLKPIHVSLKTAFTER